MRPENLESKSQVIILAHTREMSLEQAKQLIGPARFRAIAGHEQKPMFVEMLAGHEGASFGRLASGRGPGRKAKKLWPPRAIKQLARALKKGPPVFISHNRKPAARPVGKVVAAMEKKAGDKLAAVGLAYISDPETRRLIRERTLDTCSIEADIECHRPQGADGQPWVVDAVRKVSAVALGNSRLHRPGFPEARILAAVEEFDSLPEEAEPHKEPETGKHAEKPGDRQENETEAPAKVRDQNARPSELFSREALMDDPVVERMIAQCRERDAQRIQELAERLSMKDEKIKELQAELEKLSEKEKRLAAQRQALLLAEGILEGRNLSSAEREVVLDAVKSSAAPGPDLKEKTARKVEEELTKIERLKQLWAKERIAAPPEPESSWERNPLIPRPWSER